MKENEDVTTKEAPSSEENTEDVTTKEAPSRSKKRNTEDVTTKKIILLREQQQKIIPK